MNCKDIAVMIYGYHDLSGSDKTVVDDHVHGCTACREMLAEMQSSMSIVSAASAYRPELMHAAKFTGRVMDTVLRESAAAGKLSGWLDNRMLRLCLVACSVVLIVVFVVQVRSATYSYTVATVPSADNTSLVSLNTSSMLRDVRQEISKKSSERSLYLCIRDGSCSHSMIQTKKIKNQR